VRDIKGRMERNGVEEGWWEGGLWDRSRRGGNTVKGGGRGEGGGVGEGMGELS